MYTSCGVLIIRSTVSVKIMTFRYDSVCDVLIRAVDFFRAIAINKEHKNSDMDVSANFLTSA